MSASTAIAHPNIALIKYWGKADARLNLPATGSLSLTLDRFPTTTTVEPNDGPEDVFELDDRPAPPEQTERVRRFLDLVRERSGRAEHALIRSTNTVPTGAGLASSAAGFAALAVAAADAFGLAPDPADLSALARRGSGSAARSVVPGLAHWATGSDRTSVARPVEGPDVAMVVCIVDAAEKPVPSRAAMARTALTSPFTAAWVADSAQLLRAALDACRDRDLERLGRITESNALRMHAVIVSADPPIRYLRAASIEIFDRVERLRAAGLRAYATADAGPNVAVLCHPDDRATIASELASLAETVEAGPGPGAHLVEGTAAR